MVFFPLYGHKYPLLGLIHEFLNRSISVVEHLLDGHDHSMRFAVLAAATSSICLDGIIYCTNAIDCSFPSITCFKFYTDASRSFICVFSGEPSLT